MQKLNSVKGTKDIFGKTALEHDYVLKTFRDICVFNNFNKISTPILEHENIFVKTLGISSDIISKEMYNFKDQGGDDLVLRPEGTAAIVRALITNSLQDDANKNFYYHGPMFRRERPQSGRLRQFHQVGVEVFGDRNFLDDVRVIILAEKFLSKLKIRNKLKLQINTLGETKNRERYVAELKKFLKNNYSQLSSESRKKIDINPLRILDSKDEGDKKLFSNLPQIMDFLDNESKYFFKEILKILKSLEIKFDVNPFLVRGLDYYNHTAFEYIFSENKSQNAVLAGGRYDGLVKSLGGKDLCGIGWAAGVERILMIMEKLDYNQKLIGIVSISDDLKIELLKVYNSLKFNKNVSFNIIDGANFKKKMNKANKLNCYGCLILGDDEWKEKKIVWKNFQTGNQETISISSIDRFLEKVS
ncbi:MAG: histidine--tRNA ligase [Rickettsiales bacterium]|nr:histidine--tRNA ligase [Rickettsiales bacterium]